MPFSAEPSLSVSVRHRYAVAPERVYDAWIDTNDVCRWLWISKSMGVPGEFVRAEIDPRLGGRFTFVDRRAEGEVVFTGTYLALERGKRLAFTWSAPRYSPDEHQVTLTFTPLLGGCEVTLTHRMHSDWADHARSTERAWRTLLAAVGKLLGPHPA